MPTLADIAGARLPQGLDGMSMLRALRGDAQPTHPFFYWEFHERSFQQAVRMGRWKAVRRTSDRKIPQHCEDRVGGVARQPAAQIGYQPVGPGISGKSLAKFAFTVA